MIPTFRRTRGVVAALLLSGSGSGPPPAAPAPLPDPLTLDAALELVPASHPVTDQAQAELEQARAGLAAARALTGTTVGIDGRVRWVEPSSVAADQDTGDHAARLYVTRNLYDFGRSEAAESAAHSRVAGGEASLRDTLAARRLQVMERFFDVLLADQEFALDNEALATAYVTLDKLRNRHELGQVSDIRLFEMESEYQQVLARRAVSQSRQRATRARLALALGRPGELHSDLVEPDLPQLARELPEYQVLLERAEAENPRLASARAAVEAAQAALEAARAGARPSVDLELEALAHAREVGSSDDWRAGVLFNVPLYTGGAVDAAVAEAGAELAQARARLAAEEYAVREAVLETWLELGTFATRREEVRALQDYRDLYLDRSRADYEMEYQTDLGDAMVRLTEAQLAKSRLDYEAALAWERLDRLTGGPIAAAPSEAQ